jgi:hypothetical protein
MRRDGRLGNRVTAGWSPPAPWLWQAVIVATWMVEVAVLKLPGNLQLALRLLLKLAAGTDGLSLWSVTDGLSA